MTQGQAIAIATALHLALLGALSFTMSKSLDDMQAEPDFTPVEVVDIANFAQITQPPKPSMDAAPRDIGAPPEAEQAEQVEAVEPEPVRPPEVARPEPEPVTDTAPQDAVPLKPKPEPKKPEPKKVEPKKPEPQKTQPPKTEPKKADTKPAPKPVETKKAAAQAAPKPKDSFDIGAMAALIDKSKPEAATRPKDVSAFAKSIEQALPRNARIGPAQLATLEQAIRSQIAPCWNPPLGGADVAGMTVVLRIELNKDGSVVGTPVFVSQTGANAGNQAYARAFVETARRAVMRCAPLKLPADLYSHWQEFELNFDPRLMT